MKQAVKQIDIPLWEITSEAAKKLPKNKPVLRYHSLTQGYSIIPAEKVVFGDVYIFYFVFDLEGMEDVA